MDSRWKRSRTAGKSAQKAFGKSISRRVTPARVPTTEEKDPGPGQECHKVRLHKL